MHQYPETPLTEKGRVQASQAAEALQGKGITKVIASDLARAAETGSVIARALHVPLEYAEEYREVRRPTYLWGRSHYGLTSLFFFLQYFLFSVVGNIRLKNEETLRDFEKRVGKALDLTATQPDDTVAVVTHRGVMSILGATMRGKGRANPLMLTLAFLGMYAVDNAEITVAEYDGELWHIIERNKREHLSAS